MSKMYLSKIFLFITALTISNFNLIQVTASHQINSKLLGKLTVKNDIDTAPDIITLYRPGSNESQPTRFFYLWRKKQQRTLKSLYDTSWQIQLNDGEIKKLADVIDREAYERGKGLYVKTSELVRPSNLPRNAGYGNENPEMTLEELSEYISKQQKTTEDFWKIIAAAKNYKDIYNDKFLEAHNLLQEMEDLRDKVDNGTKSIRSNQNRNTNSEIGRAAVVLLDSIDKTRSIMLKAGETFEGFRKASSDLVQVSRTLASLERFASIEKNRTQFARLRSSKFDRSIHVEKVGTAFKNKVASNKVRS